MLRKLTRLFCQMTFKVEGLLSRHIDVVVFFEPKENPDVTEQMWGVLDHIAASEIIWVIPTYLQSPTASLLRDDLLITINIYCAKHVRVQNSFLYSDKSWQDAWNRQPSWMPGPSSLTPAVLWRRDKYFHRGHAPEQRVPPRSPARLLRVLSRKNHFRRMHTFLDPSRSFMTVL